MGRPHGTVVVRQAPGLGITAPLHGSLLWFHRANALFRHWGKSFSAFCVDRPQDPHPLFVVALVLLLSTPCRWEKGESCIPSLYCTVQHTQLSSVTVTVGVTLAHTKDFSTQTQTQRAKGRRRWSSHQYHPVLIGFCATTECRACLVLEHQGTMPLIVVLGDTHQNPSSGITNRVPSLHYPWSSLRAAYLLPSFIQPQTCLLLCSMNRS